MFFGDKRPLGLLPLVTLIVKVDLATLMFYLGLLIIDLMAVVLLIGVIFGRRTPVDMFPRAGRINYLIAFLLVLASGISYVYVFGSSQSLLDLSH